jgi:phosphate:Na+ symporter
MLLLSFFLLGLGLLLTGINILSYTLKRMGSQSFRRLATQFISSRWKALAFGLGSGALLQSTSAALVIMASLNCTGGITVAQAMFILTGFSVGNCILPFLVSIKIRTAVFFAVGLSAIILHFTKEDRKRNFCNLAFGLGLIFFGIEMMLEGVLPLRGEPWFSSLMEFASAWPIMTIAAGVMLGFIVQSSSAVTLVAIGLTKGGIMTGPQAFLVMYGAAMGSTSFKVLLGSAFKGSGRQLVRFVNIYNYGGAGIFIALYFIETGFSVPLVMALLAKLSTHPEMQAAWALLLFNLTAALLATACHDPLAAWLARRLPPTEEEDLSKPQFLWGVKPEDPDAAHALIQKEQIRELEQVAAFLSAVRADYHGLGLEPRLDAFVMLAQEVEAATAAVMSLRLEQETAQRQAYLQTRQTLITELADSTRELIAAIQSARSIPEIAPLAESCFEAMDFLFMNGVELLQSGEIDRDQVAVLYSDRGQQMEQLRAPYLKKDQIASAAARSCLLSLTIGVEKCI